MVSLRNFDEDAQFLPATDIAAKRVINLPVYPSLTDEEAEYVANAVLEVIGVLQ